MRAVRYSNIFHTLPGTGVLIGDEPLKYRWKPERFCFKALVFAAFFMLLFLARPAYAGEIAEIPEAGQKDEISAAMETAEDPEILKGTGEKFIVTLSANGGMVDPGYIEVENGQYYGIIPDPVYTGYEFKGWYTDPVFGDEIKADTVVELESGITLYARWKALKFTVTLNAGGGTCKMDSITVSYGKTFSELPDPEREGYLFEGWADGPYYSSEIVDKDETVTLLENTTFYARWTKIIYVQGLILNKTEADILPGKTEQLSCELIPANATYKTLKWESSNRGVAVVDESGLVTAVSEGTAVIQVTSGDGNTSARCSVTVIRSRKEDFVDTQGRSVTLIKDTLRNSYKTASGEDVLVLSYGDGSPGGEACYEFTGNRIAPGRKGCVVYEGVVYRHKRDYRISVYNNRRTGTAHALIRWKMRSDPYKAGVQLTRGEFRVIPRSVSSNMINARARNYKVTRLTINVDGRNMKPLKKEYTCTPSGNAVEIQFSNNYTGNALMRFAMDGRMLLPWDGAADIP